MRASPIPHKRAASGLPQTSPAGLSSQVTAAVGSTSLRAGNGSRVIALAREFYSSRPMYSDTSPAQLSGSRSVSRGRSLSGGDA